MSWFKLTLLLFIVGTFEASSALAATTYLVGTCRSGFTSFTTISAALAATPSPNTVLICPGTYNEQPIITFPVTLHGISNGNSDQPIIAPPAGGLSYSGIAVQLLVQNASGPVNISNITVDGTGNGIFCDFSPGPLSIYGVVFDNSPGSLTGVTVKNQVAQSGTMTGCGNGVWLMGGNSTNTPVTLQNSSIHDFDNAGIAVGFDQRQVTATITGNDVSPNKAPGVLTIYGIFLNGASGTSGTVTKNFISGAQVGIAAGAGSISANTVVNSSLWGLEISGGSATANQLFNNATGIAVGGSSATVQNNSIIRGSVGIEFSCSVNTSVLSNTITDAATGIDRVPASIATNSNCYFDVFTIRTGGC